MFRRSKPLPKYLLWLLIPLPALLIGLHHGRFNLGGVRIVDVTAAIPEAGGFQPPSIEVQTGEKVLLRFHAQDVAHGVAIGPGLGIDLGDIQPGQTKSVVLTFAEAGTFTFYCNLWCSPNHWRMRGVIDVIDTHTTAAQNAVEPQRDPVIEQLIAEGVDIDAVAQAPMTGAAAGMDAVQGAAAPAASVRPSARRGAALVPALQVPEQLTTPAWLRTHTPRTAMLALADANPAASSEQIADSVAFLWLAGQPRPELDQARTLYTKNCAACHGDSGDGQGPAAGIGPQAPASLSDPARMLDRRPDVLYAKIRRGGMGTGMPNFGTILTPGETWALVDYVWQLVYGDRIQN